MDHRTDGRAIDDGQRRRSVLADGGGDLARDFGDIGHVVRAIRGTGGPDADDGHVAFVKMAPYFRMGGNSAGFEAFAQQDIDARFGDRRDTLIDLVNFFFADIETDDVVAFFCDATHGGEAHVTEAEDCYFHAIFL